MIAHLDEAVFDEFRCLTPLLILRKLKEIVFGALYLASDESTSLGKRISN
jgi:hypothetical protein